jgi:prephenate dehydrogenase
VYKAAVSTRENEQAAHEAELSRIDHEIARLLTERTRVAGEVAAMRVRSLEGEPRFSIGILGGTQGMGAFLARVFSKGGYVVTAMGLDAGPPLEQVAGESDLVIVAVPIADTLAVIRAAAPVVRPGACLMDVTSVKSAPLDAMLLAAGPEVDVVGTHPMFGPRGDDMDRQKVVLCRGRGEAGFARVKRLFELFGAKVLVADAAEHDVHMAVIQILVHEKTMILGSVLERMRAPIGRSIEFASPIYRAELAMIGRLYSQPAGLYADILTNNPAGARLSRQFAEEAQRFAAAVEAADRGWIFDRFREVAAYFEGFAGWARTESDAILRDVVRRG